MDTRHGKSNSSRTPRLHQITFCGKCSEAIPARALSCFRCGKKQNGGGKTLRVLFCGKCGEDYPAQAMACYHCGHLNPKHPYLTGHIVR